MLKNKTKNIKGFTLIELLMVVAIIALLVVIVVVSITVARTKAGNSVIKNDVDQLRKSAETMYAENELRGYCVTSGNTACFESTNPRLSELREDIKKRSDGHVYPDLVSNENNFCISAVLSNGDSYCVDSQSNQGSGGCSHSTFLCQ